MPFSADGTMASNDRLPAQTDENATIRRGAGAAWLAACLATDRKSKPDSTQTRKGR